MFPTFDTSHLNLLPLTERQSDLDLTAVLPLEPHTDVHEHLAIVARRIVQAKKKGVTVALMIGAHVLRSGVQRYLIDLMERGYISCIATNGGCAIHDYEFALIGQTTENVAKYIKEGKFGLWQETGRINDIVSEAAKERLGLGEAIGRVIEKEQFTYRDISILAAGYRLGLPITVHVSIGYDIVYEHPNCNGAAYGATSYTDFLRFTKMLESLEGGVIMNFGSAVMAPEVYLKALAMVRNVARQKKEQIQKFTALVCDLYLLPKDFSREASKNSPEYYFRPWKTMLIRTVVDGGESYYVRGSHDQTIPGLWTEITKLAQNEDL